MSRGDERYLLLVTVRKLDKSRGTQEISIRHNIVIDVLLFEKE